MNTPYPIEQLKKLKHTITRFMMVYKFALDEMETKIEILQQEFHLLHDYNPIEHTKSRIKSPESIMKKLYRKGCEISLPSIRHHIKDIAGLRITCSFLSDIYRISDMLRGQNDLTVLEVKDYIRNPKPNGYQSLHLLIEVPVFMSDRQERVCVEVQIRTIAMDFWASLEHKIFYKYNQSVPPRLLQELKAAADSAAGLDRQMERLHKEIGEIKEERPEEAGEAWKRIMIDNQQYSIPAALLALLEDGKE
ncbi:MAG: hypothetical protein K0R28_3813 [Paenibacillus sp.]|nr:hypothetical protein [Paenibacillus sp.]